MREFMNFFEKLLVSRTLTFEPGKISFMNQRELMTSARVFAELCMRANSDPQRLRELYDASKAGYREGTAATLGKHATSHNDLLKWMTDIASFAGWGKLTWLNYVEENKSGAILIEDLPIPALLKGKVKGCADHVVRGFIAGGASAMVGSDVDCVEEECVATGAAACKFVFMPRDRFKVTLEVTRQLGIK